MAQMLLQRMLDQRERDHPATPARMSGAEMRSRRAMKRWRVIIDKMVDLMELIDVRGRVWDWLPDGSLRRLGLLSYPDQAPSLSTPTSSMSTTAAPRDKQLEYAEIIKYAAFLGTRKAKEAARMSVEKFTHPTSEPVWEGHPLCTMPGQIGLPQPGGTQEEADRGQGIPPHSAEDFEGSRICVNDGRADGGGELGFSTNDGGDCQQPAYRWQVKKLGPTQGRHFYRCAKRLCEFFVWDEIERTELKRRLDAPAIQQMEVDETEAQDELYVQGPDGGFQIAHAE